MSGIEHIPKISGYWIVIGVWLVICFILGELDNWRMDRRQSSNVLDDLQGVASPDCKIRWSVVGEKFLIAGEELEPPVQSAREYLTECLEREQDALTRKNRTLGHSREIEGIELTLPWISGLWREKVITLGHLRTGQQVGDDLVIKNVSFAGRRLTVYVINEPTEPDWISFRLKQSDQPSRQAKRAAPTCSCKAALA